MTICDATSIPRGVAIDTDICIVGAGAAGLTIARQLNGTKLDVTLLEAGGLERDLATEHETFEVDHIGTPWRNPVPHRGRWFGGSTNLWYGRIAQPNPIDFEKRHWVPHSGWPINLDELSSWLHKSADILEVPNFDKMNIENWRNYPVSEAFTMGGKANLEVFFWAKGLYMGPRQLKWLKGSKNVKVLLNATATELIPTEGASSIASLAVCGPALNGFTIRASAYVLAAGGLENPRLLLASTRGIPAGLGNARDQVGRYYMDHPIAMGLARVGLKGLSDSQVQQVIMLGETERTPFGKAQMRVTFPRQMQREEELLNHSLHANLSSELHESTNYRSAKRIWQRLKGAEVEAGCSLSEDFVNTAKGASGLVALGARRLLGTAGPTKLWLIDQMEQEPDPSSRVIANLSQRDRFSLPRLSLDWRIGKSTYRSQRRMHVLVRDILARIGINDFHSEVLDNPDRTPELWEMNHPMGTTRMTESPHHGVVDTDCRIHGVANVYVAGSSVFPAGGHANPTLLIVALAARLADRLKRHHHSR